MDDLDNSTVVPPPKYTIHVPEPLAFVIRERVVVCPSGTVYQKCVPASCNENLYKYFRGCPQKYVNCHSVECLSKWAILQHYEKTIVGALARKFWPGPLAFVLKSSGVIPEKFWYKSGKLLFTCPSGNGIRYLMRINSKAPIISSPVELFKGKEIYCTRLEHVKQALNQEPASIITATNASQCAQSFDPTIIEITPTKVKLLQPGIISSEQVRSAIQNLGLASPYAVISRPGHIEYYTDDFDVPIVITSFVLFRNLQFLAEEKQRILDQSGNAFLIDWKGSMSQYQRLFKGYTNLQSHKDLYHALYTAKMSGCSIIKFYHWDDTTQKLHSALWNKIMRLANGHIEKVSLILTPSLTVPPTMEVE